MRPTFKKLIKLYGRGGLREPEVGFLWFMVTGEIGFDDNTQGKSYEERQGDFTAFCGEARRALGK